MKSPLLLILMILIWGQIYCQHNDSMYVWANPVLEIKKTNDPNSETLSSIPFGEKVFVEWSVSGEYSYLKIKEVTGIYPSEGHDLFLSGKMVRVTYNDHIGFVHSGYLSRFPTFSIDKPFYEFLINKFDTITTIRHESKHYESTYYSHQMIFNNGINYFSYYCGSGCAEATYIIPNISSQEAFLIAYHIFRLGDTSIFRDDYCFWNVWKKGNNYLNIGGSCETDFGITIIESHSFITLIMGNYN